MRGLMMDFPLTVTAMLRRTESLFGDKTVVSRSAKRIVTRLTYAETINRSRRLAGALSGLGVRPGDRVATLGFNHFQHLEAYMAVPVLGAVLHTLNPRLHVDDIAYMIGHAGDQVLLADENLLPLVQEILARVALRHVIVMQQTGDAPEGILSCEDLVAGAAPLAESYDSDERDAAAICYTSGTTGKPKGVVYSHRAIVLHSIASAMTDALAIGEADTVMPVVPMFHVNAWGLPFTALFVGASQVLPGPHVDPESLLGLIESENVTFTAAVPTIWLAVLSALDRNPDRYHLGSLHTILCGGAVAPPAMIRRYQERYGLRILHSWGMTELTPVGAVGRLRPAELDESVENQFRLRAKQGRPMPLVEIRARNASGLAPWDGATCGELEVRGPWVASGYYDNPGSSDRFTGDGWFKTGDIVTIDSTGRIDIKDREKDLVKSGGEWISSVALEVALMSHPGIVEAAVIAVEDPRWDQRPIAVIVPRPGETITIEEVRAFLEPHFPKWWLPDAVEYVEQIPRNPTGKVQKAALRERFRQPAATVLPSV